MNQEAQAEYDYRKQERLGMICGDAQPTSEQEHQAHLEAHRACVVLGLVEHKQIAFQAFKEFNRSFR